MKKHFLLLVLFGFSTMFSIDTVRQAHLFFEQNDYQKAVELYQSIENKDATIWFNIGQCYYAQEQFFDALLSFKKAQKTSYGFRYLTIEEHIKKVEAHLQLLKSQSTISIIFSAVKKYCLVVPPIVWQVIFIFLWYLILALLWLSYKIFDKSFVALLFCLMISGGGLTVFYTTMHSRQAIAKYSDVALYAGTDERFFKKAVIALGEPVIIEKSDNNWHKVTCSAGTGWLDSDKIEEITT